MPTPMPFDPQEPLLTVTLTVNEAHMVLNALIVAERTKRRDAAHGDRYAHLHRAVANHHHALISRLDREFDRQFEDNNAA